MPVWAGLALSEPGAATIGALLRPVWVKCVRLCFFAFRCAACKLTNKSYALIFVDTSITPGCTTRPAEWSNPFVGVGCLGAARHCLFVFRNVYTVWCSHICCVVSGNGLSTTSRWTKCCHPGGVHKVHETGRASARSDTGVPVSRDVSPCRVSCVPGLLEAVVFV